jgi:hypothetical protein
MNMKTTHEITTVEEKQEGITKTPGRCIPPQQCWQLNQNQCTQKIQLQTLQASHPPQRESTCEFRNIILIIKLLHKMFQK